MLVGVRGAMAALLTAVRVAALSAAELSAAEGTALSTLTLPVQLAWGAADICRKTGLQSLAKNHKEETIQQDKISKTKI